MKFKNMFAIVTTLFVLMVATTAFAQNALVPPATSLTPYVMVTTVLGVLLGFVNNGINKGQILQNISLPKSWLPWLTIVGSFLMNFMSSLTSSGVLTKVSLWNACTIGIFGIISAGAGTAIQNHTQAHNSDSAKKALADGAKVVAILCFVAVTGSVSTITG